MPPHKSPPSLTDLERFSDSSSNKESLQIKKRLPSSRRRVGNADDLRSGESGRKSTSFHEQSHRTARLSAGRKSTSFYDSGGYVKSFDDSKQPRRKYIQESPEEDKNRNRHQESTNRPDTVDKRNERRASSSLRSSKIINKPPSNIEAKASLTDVLDPAVTESQETEQQRATIEKYKKMYEAILQDPSNAFLFEGTSSVCGASTGSNGDDTFDAAVNVQKLIEGLKLKDFLHDSLSSSCTSKNESILSEIRQGDVDTKGCRSKNHRHDTAVASDGGNDLVAIREEPKVVSSGMKSRDSNLKSRRSQDEDGGERRRPRSGSRGGLNSSIKSSKSSSLYSSNGSQNNQDLSVRRRYRSGSSGGLSSSIKNKNGSGLDVSDRSEEQQQRRRRSGSKGGLDSSMRSHSSKSNVLDNSNGSDDSHALVPRRRSKSSAAFDSSDRNDEPVPQRRRSRRRSRDTALTSSGTSQKSRREDNDCVSIASNTSTGSRMGRFFGRFSFSSNADVSAADESDYDHMTDVEDDIVPDLNYVNYEKKEKKGLFRTMKKFGKKVSKAFNSGSGFKKYKVGEVARYNIGKIRDSLESFDPQDPTVEVVIVAVHIDAVLEIPYYTIQLPDGSCKQTNMENLIPLEEYNNGTRPNTRIREKRSSSRRRSSRRDEDDDRSASSSRSNRSTMTARSNRSDRSSSRRRSSRRHDHSEDDRSVNSSSSRHRTSSRHKDRDYRPKVDAMRGGGVAVPSKGVDLKRSETHKSKADSNDDSDDEEPVIIKLTSRNSVGSSFALDAAVAAAVGVRRASASVCSASRSCSGASVASNAYNKSYSSLPVSPKSRNSKPPVVVELSSKKIKPPTVVELSPAKKASSAKPPSAIELSPSKKLKKPIDVVELSHKKKHATKPVVVVEMPPKMIRHADTMNDATVHGSKNVSKQQRRSRSTGPPRQKSLPKGTCSKCDGCHKAADCPIYLKDREQHKDSWRYYSDSSQKQMGEDGGNKRVKATRHRQPADGSCLFHSLVHCFNSMRDGERTNSSMTVSSSSTSVSSCMPPPLTAKHLRKKIANFIAANPNLHIADDPLKEWVLWDSGQSVKEYAAAMAVSGWGGGIEIAACSQLYKVNIHIYEADPKSDEYVRISCFNLDSSKTKKTLHLLYHGRNHYDALQPK